MAPSLGRFYFTRATCVTGWMMRLQRGTERGAQLGYTSVDGCWNIPWYSERHATWIPGRTLEYKKVLRTVRNVGTWTDADIYRGTQNGAQLEYLEGRWNIPWYSERHASWVPGRRLKCTVVLRTARNLGTWTDAEIYRGIQNGAQFGYLDGGWNVPRCSERRATWVPVRTLIYTVVLRTARNLGTWTDAKIHLGTQSNYINNVNAWRVFLPLLGIQMYELRQS